MAGILAFLSTASATKAMAAPPIRINEIMYDPPQQTLEQNLQWAELYNQSQDTVTIVGGMGAGAWTFQDAYGTHYFASQPFTGSMIIPAGGYALLANDPQAFIKSYPFFRGTLINAPLVLSETQGTMTLRDGQGNFLAQASWNQTQGAAGNGKTLEYSTRDGIFREGLRIGGSPGLSNSVEGVLLPPVSQPPTQTTPQQQPSPTPSPISTGQELFPVIDEIYSNPFPNQSAWIELKNETNRRIDLEGWNLHIGSMPSLIALNGVMDPGTLMLVSGSQWGFTMNPQSDAVEVVDPQKTIVFRVSYASALPQGWSANRIANGSWQASSHPTPGTVNIIALPNSQPATIPVSEIIAPDKAAAFQPTPIPNAGQFSPPALIALGFTFGAGLAGAIAFVIVKKRFLY